MDNVVIPLPLAQRIAWHLGILLEEPNVDEIGCVVASRDAIDALQQLDECIEKARTNDDQNPAV